MKKKALGLLIVVLLASGGLIANTLIATDHNHSTDQTTSHSGGTDSYGCHTDHRTGYYHCH